jgi:hypothetical protein
MNSSSKKILRRAGPFAAVVAALMLAWIPSASSQTGPPYADASGDSSSAGDLTGVTVMSDKTSGQILFRISGTNLSTSPSQLTFLAIDSDANPVTGDSSWDGADYAFIVDDTSYGFFHWTGSDWSYSEPVTARVSGGGNSLLISINHSELGNTSEFNFGARSFNTDTKTSDDAPDDGMFNYSLDAGGPDIQSIMLQTTPSYGPKAGKPFVVTPIGLKLPPDGSIVSVLPHPDSYTCAATLKGRTLAGTGTGGCTLRIPKKKARGKKLNVVVTVTYEGATKSFPFSFSVS